MIEVEVVFALSSRQRLVTVSVAPGATVGDALSKASLSDHFPGENLDALKVGIWGHLVTRDRVLSDGDRVEIYRPLELEPREARRQLARLGLTMAGTLNE